MLAKQQLCVLFVAGIMFSGGCASVHQNEATTTQTSATAGDTTIVAIAPAARTPCSVFDLLGINQAGKHIGGAICKTVDCARNRLGMRFPGLEATPPLLAITDPANLSEDSPPAVQAAAKIKQEEDAAPQKIKAIRYLAQIGCGGCYPDVEDALLAALEDCTEEVRYEAVLAIRETTGKHCTFCKEKACCGPKIQKKLGEMVYNMDEMGCFEEASERVRRQARLALAACGPAVTTVTPLEQVPTGPEAPPVSPVLPDEGPSGAPPTDRAPQIPPIPPTNEARIPAQASFTMLRPAYQAGPAQYQMSALPHQVGAPLIVNW